MGFLRPNRKEGIASSSRYRRFFRRSTEALVSRGNHVQLFKHGVDYLEAAFSAITSAERTVVAEFYIIRDDCTGCAFATALLEAAKNGVKVRLIYDYIGCFNTPSSYFRRLQQGGVSCIPFNPPPFRRGFRWFDRRDHRKMVVVDGVVAFVGGANVGDEYSGYGAADEEWRDMGVLLDGPVASELERGFNGSWVEEGGDPALVSSPPEPPEPPPAGADVMIVSGGPHHNRSLIRSTFRIAIAGASCTVRIVNPYFLPGPRVIRSLLRAAGRGVKVQLILPAKSDVPLVRLISRSSYALLLDQGIEIYELQGTTLHSKLMLIDDYRAVLGSANLDQRSFHRNYEVNIIVESREFGSRMARMFEDDLAASRRILRDEHERRGFLVRCLERCCEPVSWFL